MALHISKSYDELIDAAKEAETEDDLEKSASFYERALKMQSLQEGPRNRLMILYRKMKKYEEEEKTIKAGIKAFEEYFKKKSEKLIGKNTAASRLSNQLLKTLSKNKKATPTYEPEPIAKWKKRLAVVEKKLGR